MAPLTVNDLRGGGRRPAGGTRVRVRVRRTECEGSRGGSHPEPARLARRLPADRGRGPPAEATPIWTAVDCPGSVMIDPPGRENPTAGSSPWVNEGGLAAGADAQARSGLLESV